MMLTWQLVAEALGSGMLFPGALAAAIVLAAPARGAGFDRAAGAIGVAAGWLAAVAALDLAPLVPPAARSWQWLPTLAAVGVLIGAREWQPWLRRTACIAWACVSAWVLIPNWDSVAHARAILQLWVVGAIAAIVSLRRLAGGLMDRWVPAALAASAVCAAIVLERSGTARFAQMSAALAAAVIGASIRGYRPEVVAGYLPVAAVVLPAVLVSGWLNSHSAVPIASYLLAGFAPLVLLLPLPARRAWLAIRFVIIGTLLAAAAGLAVRAEPLDWSGLLGSFANSPADPVP